MFFSRSIESGKPKLSATATIPFNEDARRVFIMPGAGVWFRPDAYQPMGSDPSMISGSIKYAEQLLAPTLKNTSLPVEIYSYTYLEPYDKEPYKAAHYAMDAQPIKPSHYPPHEGVRAGKVILNSILKPDEDIASLGREEIAKRLSHITLIGHSYGSVQNQDIVNYIANELKDKCGFAEQDIQSIIHELVVINVANIARADFEYPAATSYYFCADNDTTACNLVSRESQLHSESLLSACGYKQCRDYAPETLDKPKVMTCPIDNHYVFNVSLPHTFKWQDTRADGSTIEREMNDAVARSVHVNVTHDFRTFMQGHPQMGRIIFNVANNAVTRDVGIGSGQSLFEEVRGNPHKAPAKGRVIE